MQSRLPIICDICGKGLKNNAGLSGHKQFAHSIQSSQRKLFGETKHLVNTEELDQRLQNLEQRLVQLIEQRFQAQEEKL